jgi:hypothetical protein
LVTLPAGVEDRVVRRLQPQLGAVAPYALVLAGVEAWPARSRSQNCWYSGVRA